jgi:hypothetical protein
MNKNLSGAMVLLSVWTGIAYGRSDKTTVNQRPNVLFIITDDHTQQALHVYGHGLLNSVFFPNMDRLANEGAIFTRSFVTKGLRIKQSTTNTSYKKFITILND